jgi:hypothetical protein
MSIACWRRIGLIHPFLIGCQAWLPCKYFKENDLKLPYRIRHKMKRQGEFLKNWLQWRLLQERRTPAPLVSIRPEAVTLLTWIVLDWSRLESSDCCSRPAHRLGQTRPGQ